MIRVTMEDLGAVLRLKVDGRLDGIWVPELEQCWRSFAERSPGITLIVDLTGTEFVDLAGKYLLSLMHQSGVQLTADSPYMKLLVAEILGAAPNAAGKQPVTRTK
jgi:anti-anti-sigma regulatory factor